MGGCMRVNELRIPRADGTPEATLQAVFDASTDAILVKDLEGTILAWNPGAERLYGYSAAEAVGRSVAMLLPPEHADELASILGRLRRDEPIEPYQAVHLHRDGSRVDVAVTISPIQGAAGEVVGASVIARDVSERVRALDALRGTNQLLRAVLDASPLAVLTVSLAGEIRTWNPAAERLTGRPAASMIGRKLPLQRRGDAKLRALFDRAVAGETLTEIELTRVRRDGTTTTLSVSAAPLEGPGGEVTGAVVLFSDVSERKRLADGLARSLRALDERNRELEATVRQQEVFIFSVSHDLRTPLITLQAMTDILLSDFAEEFGPESRAYLERVAAAIERMQSLLDDLREYTRVGRIEVKFEDVDLNRVAADVVAGLVDRLSARGAEVRIDGTLPTVRANPVRMAEVLQNLIDNAVMYTPPERAPAVVLSAREQADAWEIRVRDNGVGIPAAFMHRVFEVFQRLPLGRALNPDGSGLGLTIVARIVEVHGGRVWVESEEGKGTTIHFTIPKRQDEEIPNVAPAAEPSPAAGPGKDRGR